MRYANKNISEVNTTNEELPDSCMEENSRSLPETDSDLSELGQAALAYSRHFPIFPCEPGEKRPLSKLVPKGFKNATQDKRKIHEWWTQCPNANIGAPTGELSFAVIDLDTDKKTGEASGRSSLEALIGQFGPLPDTITAITPSTGEHLFYNINSHLGRKIGVSPGLDILGGDGYVVLEPSIGLNGKPYKFNNCTPLDFDPTKLPDLPGWVTALQKQPKQRSTAQNKLGLMRNESTQIIIPEGERNCTLNRIAFAMQSRGETDETIEAECEAIAFGGSNRLTKKLPSHICSPLLTARERDEFESTMRSVLSTPKGKPGYQKPNSVLEKQAKTKPKSNHIDTNDLTDVGNARQFTRDHEGHVKYCAEEKKWYLFNGSLYIPDNLNQIVQLAIQTTDGISKTASSIEDHDKSNRVLKHSTKSRSTRALKAMVELASSDPALAVSVTHFDTDPYALCFQNGYVDLRTGKFYEPDKKKLFRRSVNAKYDEAATSTIWWDFILRSMGGDESLAKFFEFRFARSLTGVRIGRDNLTILHGEGGRGKTTLVEAFLGIMGNYGATVNADILFKAYTDTGAPDRPTPTLATLPGIRFVSAGETEDGRHLNTNLLKLLTGGDTISAQAKYAAPFEYQPQFSIFLGTNHLPIIGETDKATWDRIAVCPFDHEIPEKDRIDRNGLKEACRLEAPGILNRFLKYTQRYLAGETVSAHEAEKAKHDYLKRDDLFGQFVKEKCVLGSNCSVTKSGLYEAYNKTTDSSISIKRFGKQLLTRYPSITSGYIGSNHAWRGIGLIEGTNR